MVIKISRYVLPCLAFLVMTGCAKHIVITDPVEIPVRMKVVPDLVAGKKVNIIGEKTLKQTKLVSAGAYGTYYASHQQWADTAVKLVEVALREKGLIIDKAAEKTLEISVSEAEYYSSFSTSILVKLKVKTHYGVVREYSSTGNLYAHEMTPFSGATWGSVLKTKSNHALTKAVEVILNDEVIIRYLGEK